MTIVPALIEEVKEHGMLYAGDILRRMNETSAMQYLPSLLMNRLIDVHGKDGNDGERIKALAEHLGVDAEILRVGAAALRNTYKIVDRREKHSSQALGSHDMSPVTNLCGFQNIWSSAILYRVARKEDRVIKLTNCDSLYERTLDFEEERKMAHDELARRGLGNIDPLTMI